MPAEIEVQATEAQGESEGPAAVAVLAQRLARSAMGVLEASELENATQVDFEHLDAGSKDEVTQKFADAIESATQSVQDTREEMFAEVIDAQFAESEPQEPPQAEVARPRAPAAAKEAVRDVKTEAAAPKPEAPAKAEAAARLDTTAPKPEAPAMAEARAKPEPEVRAPAQPAPAPVSAAVVKPESPDAMATAKPSAPAAPAPVAVQPLAQAQFMGAAPSAGCRRKRRASGDCCPRDAASAARAVAQREHAANP